MSTKHTPGPWRVDEGRSIEAMFDGEWVQIASMNREHWSVPQQDKTSRLRATLEGDARLIAAAPDLLEALEKISERDPCPSTDPTKCDYMTTSPCIGCIARAAIALATSEKEITHGH